MCAGSGAGKTEDGRHHLIKRNRGLHLVIGRSPQLGFNGLKVLQDALEFAESPAVGIGGLTRKPLRDDTGWVR